MNIKKSLFFLTVLCVGALAADIQAPAKFSQLDQLSQFVVQNMNSTFLTANDWYNMARTNKKNYEAFEKTRDDLKRKLSGMSNNMDLNMNALKDQSVQDIMDGELFATSIRSSFVLLKKNRKMVVWNNVQNYIKKISHDKKKMLENIEVKQIVSTSCAFAVLSTEGKVFDWGTINYEKQAIAQNQNNMLNQSVVIQISSTKEAFAALTSKGKVFAWGEPYYGGVITDAAANKLENVQVTKIFSNEGVFAAVTGDRIITWGAWTWGGDHNPVNDWPNLVVKHIYSIYCGFSALLTGGQVITWGNQGNSWVPSRGHNVINSSFNTNSGSGYSIKTDNFDQSNFSAIYTTKFQFIGVTDQKDIVVWNGKCAFAPTLSPGVSKHLTGVEHVITNDRSFVVLNKEGELIFWGDDRDFRKLHQKIITEIKVEVKKFVFKGNDEHEVQQFDAFPENF